MSMSTHTAAAINMRAFSDNGVVSDDEYAEISEKLLDRLQGMRVPLIRKGLELEPYTYDEYVATANENYDRAYAPIIDPEMGVELNTVTLIYRAKFSISMFLQFSREYMRTISIDKISFADIAVEVNSAGYGVVPTTQYKSLMLAGLQIEQQVKELYRGSALKRDVGSDITVETRFMIPLTIDLSDTEEMMVEIQIDIIPND